MAGTSWRQADPHQLIALQPVLTPQTANGFIIGVGRGAARHLDGWFHRLLESKDLKRKSGFSAGGFSVACGEAAAQLQPVPAGREIRPRAVLARRKRELHGNSLLPLHRLTVHRVGLIFPLLHGLQGSLRKQWIARHDLDLAYGAVPEHVGI